MCRGLLIASAAEFDVSSSLVHRTAGRAESETAAASRSRCNTLTGAAAEAGRSRCNTAVSESGAIEEGVYEAQTHFVLMQLSR